MISNRLKKLRLEKQVTQEELARKLNVSPSTISMYENGVREPDISMLISLSQIYGVTTDYILGLSDQKYMDIKNSIDKTNIQEYLSDLQKCIDIIVEKIGK